MNKNKKYTIKELIAILNHYICNNGTILGKIFFKAHLNEKTKYLPDEIDNIDNFIDAHICEKGKDTLTTGKIENIYDNMIEIKRELEILKNITNEKEMNIQFNKFIDKWLNKLKIIE